MSNTVLLLAHTLVPKNIHLIIIQVFKKFLCCRSDCKICNNLVVIECDLPARSTLTGMGYLYNISHGGFDHRSNVFIKVGTERYQSTSKHKQKHLLKKAKRC